MAVKQNIVILDIPLVSTQNNLMSLFTTDQFHTTSQPHYKQYFQSSVWHAGSENQIQITMYIKSIFFINKGIGFVISHLFA